MKQRMAVLLVLAAMVWLSASAFATPLVPADCTPDLSSCTIHENVLYQLPFLAISGDVIILDQPSGDVSDVFRIFNNIFDGGLGTGLGDEVFLYSADDGPLPDPSTWSANFVTIDEGNGSTTFSGNGSTYVLATPEPASLALLGSGFVALAGLRKKRLTA
jgi:hypothetical protein